MKNVKGNKRRWKQLMAILIVAVMLFTTPHIVGFASMGKDEATTSSEATEAAAQSADAGTEEESVAVQSEESTEKQSQAESDSDKASEGKTTEAKKEEKTEAEVKTESSEKKTEAKTEVKSETKKKSEGVAAEEKSTAAEKNSEEKDAEEEQSTSQTKIWRKTVGTSKIKVTTSTDILPEDATLHVECIIKDEDLSDIEDAIDKKAIKEKFSVGAFAAYDIYFTDSEGNTIQPDGRVSVSIDNSEINQKREKKESVTVMHVDEDSNKITDMKASENSQGDVEFRTNHFSQYVLINYGTQNIKVTVEHYDATTKKKIYDDTVVNSVVGYGGYVSNYKKAVNYDITKVEVVKADGTVVETITGSDIGKDIAVTSDTTLKVYYREKTQQVQGLPIFYDYTVMAGSEYVGGRMKYYSINQDDSYSSSATAGDKLIVGTNANNSSTNYSTYRKTCMIKQSNNSSIDANAWTGSATVVKGMLKGLGLDDDRNPRFQFTKYDPGFFTNADKTVTTSNGDTKYLRHVLYNYKLNFTQTGDKYQLTSAEDPAGTKTNAGEKFFPLDNLRGTEYYNDDDSQNGNKLNGEDHNYYFGMRYDIKFTLNDYIGDLNYQFTGDDDLWVLLDGQAVIDLGGIHDAATAERDLWKDILKSEGIIKNESYTEADKAKLTKEQRNKEHTLTVLYMERGGHQSNCKMNFTIPDAEFEQIGEDVQTADLEFTKVNSSGTALSGAEFKLYKENGETVVKTATSDANGKVTMNGLNAGKYLLRETQAPNGLLTRNETWNVTVMNGTAVITDSEGKTVRKIKDYTYDEALESKKTAEVLDYDQRTYKVDLQGSSKITTDAEADVVDVVLVVDVSPSMRFPSSLEAVTTNAQQITDKYMNSIGGDGPYYIIENPEGAATVHRIFKSGERWYIVDSSLSNSKATLVSNSRVVNSSSNRFIVYKAKNQYDRYHYLGEAVNNLVSELKKASPESNIGLVTFNREVQEHKWLGKVGAIDEQTISEAIQPRETGGTNQRAGIEAATALVNEQTSGRKQYVVLATDGAPSADGCNATTITNAATALKNAKATLMTVGVSLGDIKAARDLMNTIASVDENKTKYAYNAEDGESLESVFETLFQILVHNIPVSGAEIVDWIDDRFVLYDPDDSTKVFKAGDTYKDGIVVTDNTGRIGVKWVNQTLGIKKDNSPGWSKTIYVKAKDDFIGGNKITTNGTGSGITLKDGGNIPFENPAVNVKLLDITQADKEITVFLGDQINPATLLKQLNAEQPKINGFEKKEDGESKTVYDIPSASRLTEEELNKLLSGDSASVSKEYSYDDAEAAKDVVGKFVYTVTRDDDKKATHKTTTTGVKVETYTLNVDYIPYTMAEREEKKAPGTLSKNPGTKLEESDKKSSTNNYYVNVVAGKIQIRKKIDGTSPDADKTFTFNVEYTAPGEKIAKLQSITLTVVQGKNDSDAGSVLYKSKELPRGTYVIKEELDPEYSLKGIALASELGTTNCYSTISNNGNASSITFTIGKDSNGKVIGKDSEGNVTGLTDEQVEKTVDGTTNQVTAIKAKIAAEGYADFTNTKRLSSITIKKINADGENLQGAIFKLEKKNSSKNSWEAIANVPNITTNEDGTASFTDLPAGEYRITEIQSPNGYTLLANPIEVTLPYAASATDSNVSTEGSTPVKIGDINYYYDITYTIKNNKLFDMPEAGGGFRATIFGIAIMIIAGGWYIIRRRRRIV